MDITALYQRFLACSGVSTDTRKIDPNNLFFALKGPNFDANDFADQALEMGASTVVIDNPDKMKSGDARYFLVNDALKALQDLANYHRKSFTIPIIGLTGSNGKTTSKELLHEVLKQKFKTSATKGNLNNHIGVPITLLGMNADTEIAIVEMGANKQKDIEELCDIAEPTHGYITNIGKAHLEGMGGIEGVLKTKTELFQHLLTHQGIVFINSQDPVMSNMTKRFKDPVLFPQKGDFCEIEYLGADPFVKFKVEGVDQVFESHLIGVYNFTNIASAITIGKYFGVPVEMAAKAVAAYQPENMRSQLIEKRTNLVILDAYNANPSSMEVAIKNFAQMSGKSHKMLILGDMYELGDATQTEHEKLGQLVGEYSFDKICFTGQHIQAAISKAPMSALYFPDPFSFRNWLKDSHLEDYLILIKGSRGMKLETLVDFI
jgi:UDP-N-acetylmuramoyl-tripeptide--D-alanyl-D-alanine ligase